jgi:hypothetical protein
VFIIYRRDAANGAPERVSVRVIAKVLRAMTFNTAGQASTTNVQDTWTIRNISYDFRVAWFASADLRIGQQGDHDRSNPPNRSRV